MAGHVCYVAVVAVLAVPCDLCCKMHQAQFAHLLFGHLVSCARCNQDTMLTYLTWACKLGVFRVVE